MSSASLPTASRARRELATAGREPAPSLLDDAALLRSILPSARPAAPDLAHALIKRFGSLSGALAADGPELARAGAGPPEMRLLACMRETALRMAREEAGRRPVITSWSQLLVYVRTAISHLPREQFRTLFLDNRNVLIVEEWIADGTVDHAPVYPREVVRRALELSASALILVHNHPSGDPTPSRADIEMTRKVIDAARVFDIKVHDHLVVGREGTASFKSLGLI